MTAAATIDLRRPEELARGDFELTVRRLATDLAFGADNSRFVGGGLEYAGSRPYQPGDSVRMLDWRLTARAGRPFVKEQEALKRTALYVLLDTSASMAQASTPLSKHDLAVWIASVAGLVALRRLSPVAVVGGGERETRVVASLSRGDFWQALEPLRTRAFDESTRLGARLRQLLSRVERTSAILVLSDLHDPDALPALRQASQRHDCMVVHLVDPAEGGRLRAGWFRGEEAESGRAFMAGSGTRWRGHETTRLEILRCGGEYLRLGTDESIVPRLRRFLGERGVGSGGRR